MSTTARATAIFDADDGKLLAAANEISEMIEALEERFKALAETVGIAFLFDKAEEGLAKIAEGVMGAIEAGSHLHDLSEETGVAVEDLVVLEEQFRSAGKSAEEIGPAFAKMQKALAEGAASAELSELGVNLDELRKKTPTEQFQALGSAIAGIEDPTKRTFLAMELFGKSGASLVSVFRSGFGDAAARVGEQAQLLGQDAGMLHAAGVKLGEAGLKTQGFFVGLADRVAPALTVLLSKFENVDFARIGEGFGDAINAIIYQNDFGEFFGNSLTLGGAEFLKFMLDGLNSVADAFQHVLLASGHGFISAIDDGMANIADKMASLPGFGTVGNAASGSLRAASLTQGVESAKEMAQIGWKPTGMIDPMIDALHAIISSQIGDALSTAGVLHTATTSAFPTEAGVNEDALGLTAFGGHVSHLGSIGGAFGSPGSADPISQTNSILERLDAHLERIEGNTRRDTMRRPDPFAQ